VYPRHHTRLFSEIAEFGAIVTEFAPGTPPNAWHFPWRNRIISALSEAVVVTEGDEKSGALITARYALLQGKALFAVPGEVDREQCVGCNLLLRAGANIALSAEDILAHFRFLYRDAVGLTVPDEAMQYGGVTPEKLRAHGLRAVKGEVRDEEAPKKVREVRKQPQDGRESISEPSVLAQALATLSPTERDVYEKLPGEAFSIDHLVGGGIAPRDAVAAMTLFEILGIVTAMPGGIYKKSF